MDEKVLLRARAIAKSFGATKALKSVDLTIRRGEVHALLGGNGAGKSTLIGVLDGRISPDSGEIAKFTNHVSVVHQELAIMPDLTVAENIDLALQGRGRYHWRRGVESANAALATLGIEPSVIAADSLASGLPLHQLQLIEIARALRSGAEVILLDEPTASLTAEETDRLFEIVRSLTSNGIGIVLVSHRMHEIRQIADVVTVLRDGRTVVEARPLSDLADSEILAEMFGAGHASATDTDRIAIDDFEETVLAIDDGHGIAVGVRRGEILGLAGAPQGPCALIDALAGAARTNQWVIELNGRPWRPTSVRAALRAGIGYVSGDRSGKGVFPELSIAENAILADQIVRRRLLRTFSEFTSFRRHAHELAFAGANANLLPDTLSGGTLQKVLIARWLDLPIRVLLLEEPTRGVDVHTKTELYSIIRKLAAKGIAVIWWSTEASELLAVSDRVLTFKVDGQPATLRAASDLDETLLLADTGTAA